VVGLGGPFKEPFGSFVKANLIARALNATKRPTALSQMVFVRAFRYLYEELLKSEAPYDDAVSPTRLKPAHFNAAVLAIQGREADQSAYRVANYLRSIAETVDRKAITTSPLRWKHAVPRPETSGGLKQDRISDDFRQRSQKLLPSDEVLYAIADISNVGDLSPSDAIRQRLTDLLFCGGFRINEVLVLQRDALVEEPVFDDLGQLAVDANGATLAPYLGVRFAAEKGGDEVTGIKWIPSDLVPVARRAFSELLELTSKFADDAKFAHDNPGRVRFGQPWDSMTADTQLSMRQVAEMLGLSKYASDWLEVHGVLARKVEGKLICKKGDVERVLRARMGSLEVTVGKALVPLHKFLAVVPINMFHARKASIKGSATLVVDQNISDYLVGRGGSDVDRTKSIFERRDSLLVIRPEFHRHSVAALRIAPFELYR
jgi:hypothetical protein